MILQNADTIKFYSTSTLWSQTLKAPLYLSSKDRGWHFGPVPSSSSLLSFSNDLGPSFLTKKHTEIIPGVTAIICGGHFDGSLCLHWEDKLFTADTLMVVSVCHDHTNDTYLFIFSTPILSVVSVNFLVPRWLLPIL